MEKKLFLKRNYNVNAAVGFFLSILLTLINQFNLSLETAFLQNDPAKLHQLLPDRTPVLITLPEPFQVSDCYSDQQSFLLLKKLFVKINTLEFLIDPEGQPVIGEKGAITQARWSFIDKSDGRKYLFRVYFYIFPENSNRQEPLKPLKIKIKEIRAEKR